MLGAKIGYPVPREHALDTDYDIFEKRGNNIKQQLGFGLDILVHLGVTLLVDDTHVHFPCMQIDATVKFMPLVVEIHGLPPCFAF